MQFEDDFDDAELLAMMDAPMVRTKIAVPTNEVPSSNEQPKPAAPTAVTPGPPPIIDAKLAAQLTDTLQNYFGHSSFRTGQLDVIAAAVTGRDTCVYWSTGSGKSICYQLPALLTGKTSLVISPLVSLMEDQVTHLNNTAGNVQSHQKTNTPLAAFLGSAQTDATVEEKALRGEYKVLYVTPEKLVGFRGDDEDGKPVGNASPTYFVSRLKEMVSNNLLGLVAVDEAHCLSQWGHDFRTSYRALHQLRTFLSPNGEVPIMALTATAVSAVREDIKTTLSLKTPFIALNSVDRPNLKIHTQKKRGREFDLQSIVDRYSELSRGESAIIYCPTIRETEEVTEALRVKFLAQQQNLKTQTTVGTYHASLPHHQRKQTHHAFLTGACKIVCATTAFGMGIDKPDIRVVVHYGAPKTMEEYYQQIGRAGRDGVLSHVVMLYGENDFVKYSSDFYTAKMSHSAKRTQQQSTNALEQFARDPVECRRADILKHFGEQVPNDWKPSPEDSTKRVCGSCDNCAKVFAASKDGKSLKRDLTIEACPILLAVGKGFPGGGVSMVHIAALATDSNPPANGRAPQNGVREMIRRNRSVLDPTTRSLVFVKELVQSLSQSGFLRKNAIKGQHGSYEVFHCTPKGFAVANAGENVLSPEGLFSGSVNPAELRGGVDEKLTLLLPNKDARVFLPVPEAIVRAETEKKVATDAKIDELKTSGVNVSSIPQQELDQGSGPALNAELQWARTLRSHRSNGRDEKAKSLEELLGRIEQWRDQTASKLKMAPTGVFPSHVAKRVAYASSSGIPFDVEAIRAAGVRVTGAEDLLQVVKNAVKELGFVREDVSVGVTGTHTDSQVKLMKFGNVTPTAPWTYALYKPRKKKGAPDQPPLWEVSYNRFTKKNEDPNSIALTQESGRALQVTTVIGHLLEALCQGMPVDLKRVVHTVGVQFFPTYTEWQSLETAVVNTGQNPVGDPASFSMKEVLRDSNILGAEQVDKDRELKTDTDKEVEKGWYDKIRALIALKRVGVTPEWEGDPDRDAKRAKTNESDEVEV